MDTSRRFWLALTFVGLLGCGGKSRPATTSPPTTRPVTAVSAPAGDPETPQRTLDATLVNLEQGDIACYVIIHDGQRELSMHGEFELCPEGGRDASALIGKPVRLTTRLGNVQSSECEGNPECDKTEQVTLVTHIAERAP